MSSSSTKKAMVYRFEREPLAGFVDSVQPFDGTAIQFLNREGIVQSLPAEHLKSICFVRDWISGPPWLRNQYAVRPRQQGLWVRLRFKDGDVVEATMPNGLSAFEPQYFAISPPEPASGVQRVLVPRTALSDFEILGVVGSPLKKNRLGPQNQLSMFE